MLGLVTMGIGGIFRRFFWLILFFFFFFSG